MQLWDAQQQQQQQQQDPWFAHGYHQQNQQHQQQNGNKKKKKHDAFRHLPLEAKFVTDARSHYNQYIDDMSRSSIQNLVNALVFGMADNMQNCLASKQRFAGSDLVHRTISREDGKDMLAICPDDLAWIPLNPAQMTIIPFMLRWNSDLGAVITRMEIEIFSRGVSMLHMGRSMEYKMSEDMEKRWCDDFGKKIFRSLLCYGFAAFKVRPHPTCVGIPVPLDLEAYHVYMAQDLNHELHLRLVKKIPPMFATSASSVDTKTKEFHQIPFSPMQIEENVYFTAKFLPDFYANHLTSPISRLIPNFMQLIKVTRTFFVVMRKQSRTKLIVEPPILPPTEAPDYDTSEDRKQKLIDEKKQTNVQANQQMMKEQKERSGEFMPLHVSLKAFGDMGMESSLHPNQQEARIMNKLIGFDMWSSDPLGKMLKHDARPDSVQGMFDPSSDDWEYGIEGSPGTKIRYHGELKLPDLKQARHEFKMAISGELPVSESFLFERQTRTFKEDSTEKEREHRGMMKPHVKMISDVFEEASSIVYGTFNSILESLESELKRITEESIDQYNKVSRAYQIQDDALDKLRRAQSGESGVEFTKQEIKALEHIREQNGDLSNPLTFDDIMIERAANAPQFDLINLSDIFMSALTSGNIRTTRTIMERELQPTKQFILALKQKELGLRQAGCLKVIEELCIQQALGRMCTDHISESDSSSGSVGGAFGATIGGGEAAMSERHLQAESFAHLEARIMEFLKSPTVGDITSLKEVTERVRMYMAYLEQKTIQIMEASGKRSSHHHQSSLRTRVCVEPKWLAYDQEKEDEYKQLQFDQYIVDVLTKFPELRPYFDINSDGHWFHVSKLKKLKQRGLKLSEDSDLSKLMRPDADKVDIDATEETEEEVLARQAAERKQHLLERKQVAKLLDAFDGKQRLVSLLQQGEDEEDLEADETTGMSTSTADLKTTEEKKEEEPESKEEEKKKARNPKRKRKPKVTIRQIGEILSEIRDFLFLEKENEEEDDEEEDAEESESNSDSDAKDQGPSAPKNKKKKKTKVVKKAKKSKNQRNQQNQQNQQKMSRVAPAKPKGVGTAGR